MSKRVMLPFDEAWKIFYEQLNVRDRMAVKSLSKGLQNNVYGITRYYWSKLRAEHPNLDNDPQVTLYTAGLFNTYKIKCNGCTAFVPVCCIVEVPDVPGGWLMQRFMRRL